MSEHDQWPRTLPSLYTYRLLEGVVFTPTEREREVRPLELNAILDDLKSERDRLDRAIAALEGTPAARRGRPRKARNGSKRSRRRMSAEARKRIGEAKRKWWAERKKAGKS